jgi:plastocyanin
MKRMWSQALALLLVALAAPGVTAAQQAAGSLEGRALVSGRKGGDHAKVVVEVHATGQVAPAKAVIHQKNQTFRPDLLVVPKNSTVDFPNDDKIFHNVFSLSRAARFDLGLYKSGTTRSVQVRRAGVVDIYCNIHPNMVSQIKVVDTPYHAVTGADGRFRITGIPPGTYPVTAWVPYGEEWRGQVIIEPGKTARLELTVKAGQPPRRHLRKDGTPYGRYQ